MGAYKDPKRGTWYAAFYYKDWTGERKHKVKRGFKTMREAKEWERFFLSKESHSSDILFGAFVENYLEDMKSRIKPTTMETKRWNIDTWILPKLKNKKLKDIDIITVRNWQKYILDYTEEDGSHLSPTYIRTIHSQLSALMNYAVRNYGLPSNPCKIAGAIGKSSAEEMSFWTHDQYTQFRAQVQKRAYGLAFDILFYTGIRCGELLALSPDRFTDDLMLHVNRNLATVKGQELLLTPKTEESIRDISIPRFLYDEAMEYCRDIACGPEELIFYFRAPTIRKEMDRYANKAGLPHIRVHDLRHSHVAMLIEQGVPIKEIQKRMGHKSIKTTMDTYGHLYSEKRSLVGDTLQSAYDASIKKREEAAKDQADEGDGEA